MAETFVVTQNVNTDGANYSVNRTVSADQEYSNNVSVTGANAGTLTTRTDNDTGVVTLSGGHSVVNGRVDAYWATGKRIGMTATVAVNAVTIDGGTGDNLPTATTAVNLKNPQVLSPTIDGTAAVGLLVTSTLGVNPTYLGGTIVFAEADTTLIAQYDLTAAAPNDLWDGAAADSPIPETVGKIYFSHGNPSVTITMGTAILYN